MSGLGLKSDLGWKDKLVLKNGAKLGLGIATGEIRERVKFRVGLF